jgi:hypothetical protein
LQRHAEEGSSFETVCGDLELAVEHAREAVKSVESYLGVRLLFPDDWKPTSDGLFFQLNASPILDLLDVLVVTLGSKGRAIRNRDVPPYIASSISEYTWASVRDSERSYDDVAELIRRVLRPYETEKPE